MDRQRMAISSEEAVVVLKRESCLPSMRAHKARSGEKIIVGGLPVADRAFVFILEASTHEEADPAVAEHAGLGQF